MKAKTLGEARKELHIKYNLTINNYVKTFDLNLQKNIYFVKPQLNDIRDYQEIKDKLYQLLMSNRDLIKEYEKDYYRWKSPKEISIKIGIELDIVLKKLNELKFGIYLIPKRRYDNIKNMENNTIVENSKFNQISSYEIMKRIQIDSRYNVIRNCVTSINP